MENPDIDINETEDCVSPIVTLSPESRKTPLRCVEKGGRKKSKPIIQNNEYVSLCSLLRDRKVIISCGLYGIVAAIGIMGNEIFPLWVLNDAEHGGYSFTARDIGLVYMISAPFEIIFQIFGYSEIVNYLGGPLYALQLSLLIQVVAFVMLPFTSMTNTFPTWLQWSVLTSTFCIMVIARLSSFTSVFVLITNSAIKSKRGRVNGIGQTIAAAARVISPPLASCLFAWSEGNDLGFPLNFHLVFNILSLICLLAYGISRLLPDCINRSPDSY